MASHIASTLTVIVSVSALVSVVVALAVIYMYASALLRGETSIAAEKEGG